LTEEFDPPLADEHESGSFESYFRDPSQAAEAPLAWGLGQRLDVWTRCAAWSPVARLPRACASGCSSNWRPSRTAACSAKT
jgi:hypothetical protein